jgi:ADP-heptose:LPS heptosyltransferase
VRPDNLGDVIMLTPALRALRRAAPSARLDLLASPAGAALRPLLPDVDGLLTVSPSWQQAGPPPPADRLAVTEQALVGVIAARGYDAVLAFTSPTQSPWPPLHVALLAGVPVRVGQSAEFAGALATHWVSPPPELTHQVDRCLHLLNAVGIASAGPQLALHLPAGAADQVTGLLPNSPFALLAPGASCSARRYPAERFATVAATLAQAGLPVLVTGTAREQPLVARVVEGAAHRLVQALPVLDLPALAAVVAAAAVAVTNNSGGMHLADALGTPVAVVWSGTERVEEMAPRTVASAVLTTPVPCSPCHQFRCPYHQECLDLEPAKLAEAALQLARTPAVPAVHPDPEESMCPPPSPPVAAR